MSVQVESLIRNLESRGVTVGIDGGNVVLTPSETFAFSAREMSDLRSMKPELLNYFQRKMPQGVRLVRWQPHTAPLMLYRIEVVAEVEPFIELTLRRLQEALQRDSDAAPYIDYLSQAGILVEMEKPLR